MNSSSNLMTEGSVWKKIVFFAIPVFIGNTFQQLYNTADSLIVGNFLGSNALAVVSSAGNLIFLLIGFFSGLALGAGVVIARYIGARDRVNTEIAVHTTVAMGLVASLIMTMIGMGLAPVILKLMNTPEQVLPASIAYFRIYFAGATGFVMYNTFAGIMQAGGDSRHPLLYLIISSVINIVLDLILIAGFHMGVGATAFATAFSQMISAVLCMIRLIRTKEDYHLEVRKIRFQGSMLGRIIRFGLPSGFQNSIIGFANVVVQSYINYFGEMAMAGAGAYSKIEGFAFLPITSFTMALTTFVGQNLGAGDYERTQKGARFGTICSLIIAELIGVIIYIFAPQLIAAFDHTPEVITFGAGRARACALFYCLLAFSHAIAAILRGAGKAIVPMLIMLAFWCIIRVSILAVSSMFCRTIATVNWVYPITWSLSSIAFLIYYKRFDFTNMGR